VVVMDSDIEYDLAEAIRKDGEGRDYFTRTGKRLWEPDLRSFKVKTYKGKTYGVMRGTDQQVAAYYIDGEIFVTHHGQYRARVNSMLARGFSFV